MEIKQSFIRERSTERSDSINSAINEDEMVNAIRKLVERGCKNIPNTKLSNNEKAGASKAAKTKMIQDKPTCNLQGSRCADGFGWPPDSFHATKWWIGGTAGRSENEKPNESLLTGQEAEGWGCCICSSRRYRSSWSQINCAREPKQFGRDFHIKASLAHFAGAPHWPNSRYESFQSHF